PRKNCSICGMHCYEFIERAFSILKNWFHILQLPQKYPLEIQICLPTTLSTLHNFI
ncbi:hypothetical protein L210DRAFT_3313840, partial [Boletus edulis BED1]